MSKERALETVAQGYSGHLATASEDGSPYCIPLLYLWMSGELYVHTTSARGHLRANIENEPLFDVPVFADPYPAE
jgi:nitroimidazol reductase NimA-like FMN-containing flavoprotein (pyridoxamine 5'-phosphate oxidase superfamily)